MDMSASNFPDISSELIKSVLCDFIENELKLKNYKFDVKPASKSGVNNFVGIVYRVYLKENESEGTSLILKTAPQNMARRTQFCSRLHFEREISMYNEVIKLVPS